MPDYPAPAMEDVDFVVVLRALADPTRLHIVRLLENGEPRAKTLEGWGVELTKATMAHHFRILRESGLTNTLIHGRTHAIQLRRAELDEKFPGLLDSVIAAAPKTDG